MSILQEITEAIETGQSKVIDTIMQKAIAAGENPNKILDGMVRTMDVVGDKFSKGEIYVPEMLVAARTMKKGIEVLKPYLMKINALTIGKCIIGTVAGDLHDIGKNLVSIMMESVCFEIIDLGVDVSAETFINAMTTNPDMNIVACSALLTTTMPTLQDTVRAIKESGMTGFKIMVGGAPITPEFAVTIGADGYAPDAGSAAMKAKELVSSQIRP